MRIERLYWFRYDNYEPALVVTRFAFLTRSISVILGAGLLLWPAVWNGYPIVFADTGTYLSQATHRYAGWDRPVFYSLFMLPLHATISVWPVVVAQALIAAAILHLVCRVLVPALPAGAFVAGVAALSAGTWLPFLVSELMPDLFTPLLVLLLTVLVWVPNRFGGLETAWLLGLAAFMIATQQSSLPLSCLLLAILCLLAWCLGRCSVRGLLLAALAPVLATVGLCSVNLAAHGRFAVSPYGNIFLLARVIYDGPGLAALRDDCPARHWRLCPFLDRFPADSDSFLWTPDSPLNLAGGPKAVAADAGAIIAAALRADPTGELQAVLANGWEQMRRFASGDGLEPWPAQVTPWIGRDFPPREQAAYDAARQQNGALVLPAGLSGLHRLVALAGIAGCLVLLPLAARRRSACFGFLAAALLVLPVSAAITGGLSAPHDRYQARIMWLPPFIAAISLVSLRRPIRSAARR